MGANTVKHHLPMRLADGNYHIFPTTIDRVYKADGETPLYNEETQEVTADNALKLGGKEASEYALIEDLPNANDDCVFVTPQMFGAVGNGKVDDSAAIQAAFDASDRVLFPKGDYLFSGIKIGYHEEIQNGATVEVLDKDKAHGVYVRFVDANLVPVHPTYTRNSITETKDDGVFCNFFKFIGCSNITMEGLQLIRNETPIKRVDSDISHCPVTRSIAEFIKCKNVILKNWHVGGISLWNRGNTPADYWNRRGIVFSAIDTDIVVKDSTFENLQWDEWTWCSNSDKIEEGKITNKEIYNTRCTFDNCIFRSPDTRNLTGTTMSYNQETPGLSCIGIVYASEAIVQNCLFEKIKYAGSLANVIGYLSIFRDNSIVKCNLGSVCDTIEGASGMFGNESIIYNNDMSNSTCNTFVKTSAKQIHLCNNRGIQAGRLIYSNGPNSANDKREGATISSMRTLIDGNDAVCTGLDWQYTVNADDSKTYSGDNSFIRLSYRKQNDISADANIEVIITNNNFSRKADSTAKNSLLFSADVDKIVVRNNNLFYGTFPNQSSKCYSLYMHNYTTTAKQIEIQVVNNSLSSLSIPSTATVKSLVGLGGNAFDTVLGAICNNVLYDQNTTAKKSSYIVGLGDAYDNSIQSGNAGFLDT